MDAGGILAERVPAGGVGAGAGPSAEVGVLARAAPAAELGSAAEADALCRTIRSQGGDCQVKR